MPIEFVKTSDLLYRNFLSRRKINFIIGFFGKDWFASMIPFAATGMGAKYRVLRTARRLRNAIIFSIETAQFQYLCIMGRNNERNIKKHNDKLHKAQDKAKKAAVERREKLSAIVKKYNETNPNTQQ